MKCNLFRFLEQTELECRRIAKSCNAGTQGHQEWLKTAETLLRDAESMSWYALNALKIIKIYIFMQLV